MNPVEQFEKLANKCSYHFADNSCREWHLADDAKCEAMTIYEQNPLLRAEMYAIGVKQLWVNDFKRIAAKMDEGYEHASN